MNKSIILFFLAFTLSNIYKKTNEKQEKDENLKLVKPDVSLKKKKRDLLSSNNNLMECFLSFHTFPLQYFIEAERAILRLRFISNCFPSKDVVLISNINLNEKDETITLNASILEIKFEFHFSNVEIVNSGAEFSKMNYKTVEIIKDEETVEMNTFGDNNMIVKIIMNDVEMDNYQLMKRLVTCGNVSKNILCNEYDFFNPV